MKCITFYAYKGGTGRTLTAVNFAVYLARLGLRAILLDMDLEAPGVDAKFPDFELPRNHPGVLDYILEFQQTNSDPGSVRKLLVDIPVTTPRANYKIGLIPAGDYLSADYTRKLNELDWGKIFSSERDGVAFFKQLLLRIETELKPDFLIVDSRTGIGEISGVCTQQLADEVVMLSSLAGESVRMSRFLMNVISKSRISAGLGKTVEVKVVLARVPRPKNPSVSKKRYSDLFQIAEPKLFYLFSTQALEQEEFIALLEPQRDQELVNNYIQLFRGLNIQLADEVIREQIKQMSSTLLLNAPTENEARISELVALYPHAEVYRMAMRYFRLARNSDGVYLHGFKLLDLNPDDEEAQEVVFETYFQDLPPIAAYRYWSVSTGRDFTEANLRRISEIGWTIFNRRKLPAVQQIAIGALLERVGEYGKAHEVAMSAIQEKIQPDLKMPAYSVAARTAVQIGKSDLARQLIGSVPADQLRGSLAVLAVETLWDSGEREHALSVGLDIIRQDITLNLLKAVVRIARELGKKEELVRAILESSDLGYLSRSTEHLNELSAMGLDEIVPIISTESPKRRRRLS